MSGSARPFLEAEIDARRGKPVSDLLGSYVNAEIDGAPIPPRELLGLVQLLVVAGHETTVNGMGMLLYRLCAEPGLRDRVLADRSLVDKVIDEALRLHPPVWNMGRTVREATTVRGASLCPGEKVMLVYGGANRDPDKFDNPEAFDIDRQGIPSSFGRPAFFVPIVERYLEQWALRGHEHAPEIGAAWHLFVAPDSQVARSRWEPRYRAHHEWMQRLLGQVNPAVPAQNARPFDFDWLTTEGPAIVGSPAEVTERIADLSEQLRVSTHLLYLDMGGMVPGEVYDAVDLFGAAVIPALTDVTV
jgi:Cytochrome P450